MTTSITSAFSASGAILPLILSPTLVEEGWRSTCWLVAAICAAIVPAALWLIRPGPLSVGRRAGERDAADGAPTRQSAVPPAEKSAAGSEGQSAAEALRDGFRVDYYRSFANAAYFASG